MTFGKYLDPPVAQLIISGTMCISNLIFQGPSNRSGPDISRYLRDPYLVSSEMTGYEVLLLK